MTTAYRIGHRIGERIGRALVSGSTWLSLAGAGAVLWGLERMPEMQAPAALIAGVAAMGWASMRGRRATR